MKQEQTYKDGQRNGQNILYFENGNKKEVSIYVNDVLHGTSIFYDDAGKIVKKRKYVNGIIINVESFKE